MSNGYFHRVMAKTPTVFWINNVTLEQADMALESGARNCTQNPSFPWKMLNGSAESEKALGYLDSLLASHPEDEALLAELQYLLIRDVAERFRPLHRQSAGYDGWVTIQGSPMHEDTATILAYAKRCRTEAPNLMLKIPATPSGLAAMEKLAAEGCPLLATEVMSVAQAMDVCEIFEKVYRTIENPPAMALAHIPGIFDEQLGNTVVAEGIQVDPDALWQAGILVAKKIRRMMDDRGYRCRMLSGGARGLHHFTEMVGACSGVTINWDGAADKLLEQDGVVVDRFHIQPSPDVVDELREKLPEFRAAWDRDGLKPQEYEQFGPVALFRRNFEDAWKKALDFIANRRQQMA